MPNLYANLGDIKAELGITATTSDSILLLALEDASREVDAYCNRHFYVKTATKYFGVANPSRVLIDDCLSVTTLTTDSEGDGTFDGETWTQGDTEDFILWPYNDFPKLWIETGPESDYAFACDDRYIKIVGLWGYGDGQSATPYRASGLTGTLSDASDTTITASADASAIIYAGQTLLIESEQVYVSSVSTTTLTVERGVNGTTAAAHTAAAMNIYKYPSPVARWTRDRAKELYVVKPGFQMEMIGQYQYQIASQNQSIYRKDDALGPFQRMVA